MLDIKLIRDNPELVENDLKRRGDTGKIELLHKFIEADRKRRDVIQKVEALRKERNEVTDRISKMKSEGKDATSIVISARQIPEQIKTLENQLEFLEKVCSDILMVLPNILDKSVPLGKDDSENVEIRRWGEQSFDFQPKNHVEILQKLDLIDGERAAKIAGHGFFFLKNGLVLLDMALQRYAIDFLRERGFTVIEPPLMMMRRPYEGVTDLGTFAEVLYKVGDEDLHMIATSEHPMAAMHMDEVLLKDDLPVKLAGVSPCFRKEVGAHGRYTRGLFRMHHFNKVEQFVFCLPQVSWQVHEELQHNSELMLQEMEIPHRIVNVCTGDIGSIAAKKYDIEFQMADGNYREIGSNSNCTDYQARSLNIKYREKEGAPPAGFPHTLNNTAIATSRAMIAIIENHQRADGTVDIPKVLQPYTGFKRLE